MSDSWELICGHTYTGIPGIVVDSSPSAASYGQTLGLDDTDFLKDGAAAGSGAVRFYKPGSVYVPVDKAPWRALGAVRGEVTFRRQPATTAFLLDGDTFEFHIRSGAVVSAAIPCNMPRSFRASMRSGRSPTKFPSANG
jgi:hypothetical protein